MARSDDTEYRKKKKRDTSGGLFSGVLDALKVHGAEQLKDIDKDATLSYTEKMRKQAMEIASRRSDTDLDGSDSEDETPEARKALESIYDIWDVDKAKGMLDELEFLYNFTPDMSNDSRAISLAEKWKSKDMAKYVYYYELSETIGSLGKDVWGATVLPFWLKRTVSTWNMGRKWTHMSLAQKEAYLAAERLAAAKLKRAPWYKKVFRFAHKGANILAWILTAVDTFNGLAFDPVLDDCDKYVDDRIDYVKGSKLSSQKLNKHLNDIRHDCIRHLRQIVSNDPVGTAKKQMISDIDITIWDACDFENFFRP